MPAMFSTGGTVVALVFAALVGRREVERGVASRQVGVPVALNTLNSVLDVGDGLWRGPAPTAEGYQELAAAGCSLIVDLRAEADLGHTSSLASTAGLDLVVLSTPNSRAPAKDHVDLLARAHAGNQGATYVHCEAGEGRTGALIGALQVRTGISAREAIADALAIGSLTFSQIAYIASGGRAPMLHKIIDLAIDRPTEACFDRLARREG